MNMLNLKNKTALITGGGTGIGRSIALHLAQEGCNLVLTGLGISDLEAAKAECEKYGVKAYATETQLDDYASIDRLYDFVISNHLSIDIFVLNAGISQREKAFDTDISVDEKILKIDFLSGVYLVKKFKEMIMAKEHVQFSVTTSLSGLFGFPLRSAYCGSWFLPCPFMRLPAICRSMRPNLPVIPLWSNHEHIARLRLSEKAFRITN